jgi:ethanolamine permease
MEYIIYTADTCLSLNDLIVQAAHLDRKFSPIIWLVFYLTAVSIHCVGGKVFWRVSNILAFLSITIIIIYCLGSLKFVDFRHAKEVTYVSPNFIDMTNSSLAAIGMGSGIDSPPGENSGPAWFIGGGFEFMRVLPLAGWMYVGIETLNFASNDIAEVRQSPLISLSITFFKTTLLLTDELST